MGDRLLPAVLKIVPADKSGEYTELVSESMRFDLEMSGKCEKRKSHFLFSQIFASIPS